MRRRDFLRTAAVGAAVASPLIRAQMRGAAPAGRKAQIALTVNLEMSRNFPRLHDTHWDYEKGNLDAENKRYAVELGRLIKRRGTLGNYFVVGQVLEHESVDWLEELHREGHVIGNHTYYHVNMAGAKPQDLQFRFRRAPWLVEGKTAEEVVEEDIRLANAALRHRIGIEHVRGFRSSNEYQTGLDQMPKVQEMLKRIGFDWVGTKYAAVPVRPLERASEKIFNAVVESQERTQPYLYPNGLVEIPKSAISDISAFRTGRWGIGDYLEATRRAAQWAIDHGAVYVFTVHSSVQVVVDPEFKVFELLFDLVSRAGDRAEWVTMNEIADRVRAGKPPA